MNSVRFLVLTEEKCFEFIKKLEAKKLVADFFWRFKYHKFFLRENIALIYFGAGREADIGIANAPPIFAQRSTYLNTQSVVFARRKREIAVVAGVEDGFFEGTDGSIWAILQYSVGSQGQTVEVTFDNGNSRFFILAGTEQAVGLSQNTVADLQLHRLVEIGI